MSYRAPVSEFEFLMSHVVGMDRVAATDRFAEATPDTVHAVLREAGKMAEEVLAPLNRAGDLTPARLENGVVRTSPGFADGYRAIAEGGYVAISADPEYGGLGLPMSVTTAINEMIASACLSLQLNPLMTQGQIEALENHASDEIKALYLPKLVSGEWTGTMNLTEPQAGSDVGALRSKAEPNGDGTYAVTGQKIYISWGDNDFTENVCHLVLARLPDGGPGTKGISLFLVPRDLPTEGGGAGVRNSLKVVSLEHKLGLHGSPTAVMQYDGATGWLVGEAHQGMAAMFTMMNNARLGVGVQGVGVAEAAYQHALSYAMERKQGRSPEAGTETILGHADVRRMLTAMKAETFAARALTLDLAVAIDLAHATGDAEMAARAAFLTPICKAYGTDTGIAVADAGVQVHGGMGFIEETGAAQYLRDVRVTAIYEGTNGIQSMDLVGRKMMDGGAEARLILDEIAETAAASEMGGALTEAVVALRAATESLVEMEMNDRFAGSVPYLRAFALALGGHYHLKAAMADPDGPRARLAASFLNRQLPELYGLLAQVRLGAADLYALSDDDLVA
ncbi:acyl-CoA dehydrogenase [Roseobacter sp. HKCCD9010]|uniref:acyl-CoA dehydrogenase n=1 Tax=unclassified Roseobacter TaxID=196798 RepID=UPI001492F598|nr:MULTISPECIES: acyl-CoA dehydrogenase [unclassified Roseobacter]MBF9048713.1 acyl-CoA dehydrogenase [Rhodobacterales bacterium HKCCD4356]NNV10712.1 acyl-CoA dehydrogenase [Roseobacter sp. HKCCD7357]NNV14897.1 acyl-CoA dehydrogenase [Roseobacter sp. HKCCD8768]NNV24356.1 acyl-CoA dehydrogenase [Roseobacter sp. HKCCD8192]NNV28613.1 acyl-CoA dehydrogenase [Roseobacter sp. HKCCD9061]